MSQILVARPGASTAAQSAPGASVSWLISLWERAEQEWSSSTLAGVGKEDQADSIDVLISDEEDSIVPSDLARLGVQHGRLISDTGPSDEPPGLLFAIGFDVPEPDIPEFEAWYEQEHVPLLFRASGWLRVRRYAMSPGPTSRWNRFALHEIRDMETWDGPEKLSTRTTPWRAKLAATPWYQAHERGLFVVVPVAGAH